MKVSIIIVNYNVKFYLEQCIRSIEKAGEGISHEIIVADNNSSDDSIAFLKERFPQVTFIENKENLGFAKANNQAIKKAKGEYIMLLNPDTILGESALQDCVTFMDRTPNAGATGVKMLKSNGKFALESRRGIPTPFTSMCKMLGLCNMFPKSKTFGKYYMQYLDENKQSEIEIISGACMFIRKSTLDKSGLLDEDFFMYGEDIDLSYRLLKTGMTNHYIPTNILHYKGESTEKTSYRYVYVFYQAMLIFFRKHYSHYSIFLSIPIKAAIYSKAVCAFINQQTKRLIKKTNIKEAPYKFLIVAPQNSCEKIAQILNINKQKYDVQSFSQNDTHISTPAETSKYDYIIYDAEHTSYAFMLEQITISSKWAEMPKLAVYHSQSEIIITEERVWQNI